MVQRSLKQRRRTGNNSYGDIATLLSLNQYLQSVIIKEITNTLPLHGRKSEIYDRQVCL